MATRDDSFAIHDKEKEQALHLENEGGLGPGHFAHMSPEERQAAMQIARSVDPGPAAFSSRNLRFIASLIVVIMCSCDTGFDTTIMSSVNSMTQFQSYFGLVSASTGTGILFVSPATRRDDEQRSMTDGKGVYTVGGVSAFFFNIWMSDVLGRRVTMFMGNFFLM